MKYFFCLLLFLFLTNKQSFSQNLVPNGDFEQYSSCPVTFSQIDSALFWTYPTEYSSSDYFNTCVTSPYNVGVPVNQGSGYQYARSGNGYAGIFLTFPMLPDTREYIEVPLTAPLIANGCYHFEMYVNILNACKYSTDAIGVYFSDTLIKNIPGYGVLPYTPQINGAGGAIYDTLNWALVSGTFTATGGEQYMVIGNFKDDANTPLITIGGPFALEAVYTYIDDVSLTICTGVNEVSTERASAYVYPNPFADMLNVTADENEPAEIILYDITYRQLKRQSFSGSVSVNTTDLAKGTYLYKVQNKNGVLKTGKIIKDKSIK